MSAAEIVTEQEAASHLRLYQHAILGDWDNLCRQEFSKTPMLSARLHQHMADLVQDLLETLESPKSQKSAVACRGVSLEHLLHGYHVLREALVQHLLAQGPLGPKPAAAIRAFIDARTLEAVQQYMAHVSTSQAELQHNLQNTTENLRSEQHKLETLFATSPAAIALVRGTDMVFEQVNPSFTRALGERDFVGKTFREALPELDGQDFARMVAEVYSTGKTLICSEVNAQVIRHKDKPPENSYWDFAYIRVCDDQGDAYGVYNYAYDVTERVAGRKLLEQAKKDLERAVADLQNERDLRDRYVVMLTHDLRAPLTSIKLSAEQLLRRVTDKNIEKAQRIVQTVNRANQMIQSMLDANRVRAGQALPIALEDCRIDAVFDATIKQLHAIHGDRFEVHGIDDTQVQWDPNGIQRILENLCGNAVKYGTAAPVTIAVKVQDAESVEISVHNEGTAIDVAEQAMLFDPFHRSTSANRGVQTGWGIGLTVVKGIAEAHHGSVGVRSSRGQGTTFYVHLPRDASRTS